MLLFGKQSNNAELGWELGLEEEQVFELQALEGHLFERG